MNEAPRDRLPPALRRTWLFGAGADRAVHEAMAQSGADEGTKLRVAKNMPIQGTNADMTKLAMARIARALAEGEVDAALVNMVHDEIVVEAAATAAERAREIVETEMVSAGHEFIRRVPVVVDTHVGEAWQK